MSSKNFSAKALSAKDKIEAEQLTVEDIMTCSPAYVVRDQTLGDVEKRMKEGGIRHLPVVDGNHFLVGLISHRDLLRFSLSELSEVSQLDRSILYSEISVGELMQNKVQSVTPETSLKTAAILMAENKYGCLPVTTGKKLVGIITEGDFLRFVAEIG